MGVRAQFAPFLLALALPACSSTETGQVEPDDVPTLSFEKFTLGNGLEVILSEDHRLPLVAVNLWYHVGPANEDPGRTGFAHLFEHMMFQGSKHVAGDSHFRLLEGAGASDVNGTTDFDRTNYFQTVPADELELALWLESDRMGYLLDEVDQAKLSNQQDVVRNERRQRTENRPYGLVEEALFHQLFPEGHPYYASIIGSHADIQAASLEEVKSFFKLYYAPNNASLAIVGDIDVARTRALVEKYFGALKRGEPVPGPRVVTPPIAAERRMVVADRVELPRVYMAWHTPPIFTPGDAEAEIAGSVLGGGRSSRLYKALVYDQQVAQAVSAYQQSLTLGSVFTIVATARPGRTAEELERAIDAELARLRDSGPDQAEVDRARNTVETRIVQGLERLGGFGGVADRLNLYNHHVKAPGYLDEDVRRYRGVTPSSVKTFAASHLVPSRRALIHAVPGEPDVPAAVPRPALPTTTSGESVNADEPWRHERPAPGQVRPLQIPVPESFSLPNGLTVLVNERPGLPVVSASLVVNTGSEANPVDRPGLASFTAAMLDEGTARLGALEIADEVARLGASLSTGSTADSMQVTGGSLRRTFPALLDIMADLARHPAFPDEEIERQRASRLASLAQQRDNPGAVSNAAMYAALYGPGHPYGYTELGTDASNRAIAKADLQRFWSSHVVPSNAALVVSGAIAVAELRPLVEQAFGDWPRGAATPPSLGEPQTTGARLVLVDRSGAPQTQVRIASIGVPRATPDYESILVMNEALGGLFSSRINLNLREQHGYTYGAGSQFTFRRSAGPFYVASAVRTDVTAPAVAEVFKEIGRIREAPLTLEELALAKDSLVRSLPSQFETSGRVTSSTANTFVYGLGIDYYTKIQARLSAVSLDQVTAAAERYIVPDRLIVVAVGDTARIRGPLEKLSLGAIEVRNTDGALTPQ
jgi:zinc protease